MGPAGVMHVGMTNANKEKMAMADENDNDLPEDEPSFAELLESYSGQSEDALQVGDKVAVRVIAVGKDAVFVDTGTKIDGSVERDELLDDDGNLTCEVGDTLDLFVVARDEGEIRLSRALSGIGGLQMLQEAHDSKIPVEGKVQATCNGGFDVRLLRRRAASASSPISWATVFSLTRQPASRRSAVIRGDP